MPESRRGKRKVSRRGLFRLAGAGAALALCRPGRALAAPVSWREAEHYERVEEK